MSKQRTRSDGWVRTVSLLLALALAAVPLAGCGDDGGSGADDADVPVDGTPDGEVGPDADADADGDGEILDDAADRVEEVMLPPVEVTQAPDLLQAADPKLPGFDGWPLVFDVDPAGRLGLRCHVVVTRDATTLATLDGTVDARRCAVAWDGRAADGSWLTPGAVTANLQVLAATGLEVLAEVSESLEIVRLGISAIRLQSGATGKRVELLWSEMGGIAEGYYLVGKDEQSWKLGRDSSEPATAVDLELADGSPRPLPALWTDLKGPPVDAASSDGAEHDTYDLPTAWIAGSLVEATAQLSSDVAGEPGGGAPVATEVRVVAPAGTRLVGDGAFAAGGTVTVRPETSPVPAVGRYDWPLEWRFESRRPGGAWVPMPGGLATVHRLYGLVGLPSFTETGVPHVPWVEVVDTIAGWVDGATADPVAVAGRIVEGVYYEMGLRYDDEYGASAYTEYLDGWDDGVFHIVEFQRRDSGSVINCSDAASIVSGYANMVGIDFRYHIITHQWAGGFDLNYIQAIGFTAFTETPFRGGGGAFSYHAIAGPPDGSVYDATLALDDDGTPGAPPHTALLANGITAERYLFDLTSQWDEVMIFINDTVSLQ
jgi:hypothetical protein